MDCPICKYKGLEEDIRNCPSCNADLSAFLALDAVEKSMHKQKERTLLFIVLFLLAFMASFVIYFIFISGTDNETNEKLLVCTAELEILKAENQMLTNNISNLEAEQRKLKKEKEEAEAPKTITHVVKKGESLYFIARDYLGNGDLYPKIAADNNISDPDIILVGTELIIYK